MTDDEREERDLLILADLEKGEESQRAIARRHGVSRGTVQWVARRATGVTNYARKPCARCGRTIRAVGNLCADCRLYSDDTGSPEGLDHWSGAWVPNGRGIVVWREYAA